MRKSKEIVKEIKSKADSERKLNYTFRLKVTTMEAFKKKCEEHEISMTSVIEEMLTSFIED